MTANLPPDSDVKHIKKNMIYVAVCFTVIFVIIILLSSCQYVPDLAKDVDDIATHEMVEISISKDAIQKETDIALDLKITNKDGK